MKISNQVYDILKWLCILGLPALSTLYTTLAGVWGWSFAEQMPATFTALSLFLGTVLGVSSVEYNKRIGGGTGHDE